MRGMWKAVRACALAVALVPGLWPSGAAALVTSVTVKPNSVPVPFNRPATVRITWLVSSSAPAGTFVYSNGGLLQAADPGATFSACSVLPIPPFTGDVATPFGVVSGRVDAPSDGSGLVRVRETLRIPVRWLVWARENGYRAFHYIRYFDDGGGQTACTAFRFHLAAGGAISAVEFGLSYIRMRFDDGRVARVVARGSSLGVRAEVRYRGHGLLRAVWEVADPASTRTGSPLYVPLQTVHRYLTGAGQTVLEGPRLPTGMTGLHLVRLRLIEPAIDAPNLFLRYFVRAAAAPPARLAGIALQAPAPGAGLRPDTRFAWAPVPEAAAYRIELYETPGGFGVSAAGTPPPGARPVTGMLLPGGEHRAALSALARKGLRGPAVYLWRVVAFDAAGRMVAASPYRRLVVPADGGAGAGAEPGAGGG